ncbi:MAG: DnaJ domain-containing protein [Burkholderiales bacterium]|jgi:DnaJ-class molecular chaperone|nr:DnaJ domain-containing protein [Burkholderiales bacterium]
MPVSTTDPYDILGVASQASDEDIKRAFRRKASAFHPDRNPDPDASQRFREAQQAYELLIDPERRQAHDQRRQKHLLDDPEEVAGEMFEAYLDECEE